MIFKIIALIAAAIPIFLFVRSVFFQRTTRVNEGLREFKKQANLAVSIFLFLIVCKADVRCRLALMISGAIDPSRTWDGLFCCDARPDLLYLLHDPCLG
jgi:hypothetical protein